MSFRATTLLLCFFSIIKIKAENLFENCLINGGQKLTQTVCIPQNHEKDLMPQIPLKINATIGLKSIQEISHHEYAISGLLWVILTWNDPGLVANETQDSMESTPTKGNSLDLIWSPDLFVYHLLQFKEMNVKTKDLVHFANINGQVYVSTGVRYLLTTSCDMEFSRFPFDIQNCQFEFGLVQMNSNFVEVKARLSNEMIHQFSKEFEYDTQIFYGKRYLTLLGHNNTFETFGITLQLSRNVNCYVWNYFIPVFGMSLTGSISFIITPEAVPGRIGLLITLQLVLIQIFQTVQVRHFNFILIDLLSRHTILKV